jgi:hypothetical protein
MVLKILIGCATVLGILFLMGEYPAVAVAVTAIIIILAYKIFDDKY